MATLKPAFVPACEAGSVYQCQPFGGVPVLAVPAIAVTGVFATAVVPSKPGPPDWLAEEWPDPDARVRNTVAAAAISMTTTPSAISMVRRRFPPAGASGPREPGDPAASVPGSGGTAVVFPGGPSSTAAVGQGVPFGDGGEAHPPGADPDRGAGGPAAPAPPALPCSSRAGGSTDVPADAAGPAPCVPAPFALAPCGPAPFALAPCGPAPLAPGA